MKSSNILQRQIIDIGDSLLMARSLRSEEYSQHQYRQFKKVGLGPVWQANFCKVTPCSLRFVRFPKLRFVRCAKP